jgi:hypothetical protein
VFWAERDVEPIKPFGARMVEAGVEIMRSAIRVALMLAVSSSFAMASDWRHYGNARFQYGIDIPPGFSGIVESDNGDGGVSRSVDGRAELAVWGSYLADRGFAAETGWRLDEDRRDGWTITYRKQAKTWAVWSGVKDNRIVYERAIAGCGDAAAYFRLEYDRDRAATLDSIVARLGKSLRKGDC